MRVLSAVILFHIAIWQITEAQRARIFNGQLTDNSDVPYIVYLKRRGRFICGGTMVSAIHVVTAAHCVSNTSAIDVTVTGGATYLYSGGHTRQVQKIFEARTYSPHILDRDVAVLKLEMPMPDSVKYLPLCTKTIQTGDLMKISGWGRYREGSRTPSIQLRTIQRPAICPLKCRKIFSSTKLRITNDMLCVASHDEQDACRGDSGGPAVHDGQLCGIVSWGIGCARKGYPGVYTNVKQAAPFIMAALSDGNDDDNYDGYVEYPYASYN